MPSVDEYLQIQLKYDTIIKCKRFFITPYMFGGTTEKLMAVTARQDDQIIRDAYRDIDSVEIKIPAGYRPESVPKDISRQTKFGKYISSVKVLGDKIIYCRFMEEDSGRFPAKEFNELVKFHDQVYRSDRSKLVLIKTE